MSKMEMQNEIGKLLEVGTIKEFMSLLKEQNWILLNFGEEVGMLFGFKEAVALIQEPVLILLPKFFNTT